MSNLLGPLLGGLLTVAFGWRANWWALVPLAAARRAGDRPAACPRSSTTSDEAAAQPVLNRMVLAATLVAALTFAVMIGCFYLA